MFIRNSENIVSSEIGSAIFGVEGRGFGCGQAVMNCINDAYNNHGWASFWAVISTAYSFGATFGGISAACILKNCGVK